MELGWTACFKKISGVDEQRERTTQHKTRHNMLSDVVSQTNQALVEPLRQKPEAILNNATSRGLRRDPPAGLVPDAHERLPRNVRGAGGSQVAGFTTENRAGLTRVLQPAQTLRLRPEPEAALSESPCHAAVTWHGVTDKGKVRDHNEDNFSLLAFGDGALFVVADGMGGHDAGEVASRIAMETVCRFVQEENKHYTDPLSLVECAVQRANIEVNRQGACARSNMGTTLSVALVADDTAYIANVGDSRVYWIDNGSISQITTDHSLVAMLVGAGKLTREEARNHPRSNLLYRTIGTDETVTVDTFRIDLKKGGTLLLCTDGLWGEVTDEDIHRVCAGETDAKAAGDRLVQMANEHGGKDNITAVVVKIL